MGKLQQAPGLATASPSERTEHASRDTNAPVYAFAKNERESVLAHLCEFRGQIYADVRLHYRKGDQLLPSPKGIRLHHEFLPDLARAIAALQAAVDGDDQ